MRNPMNERLEAFRFSIGQEERQAMTARDAGLKPDDFDAMTAVAWIDSGDSRTVKDHEVWRSGHAAGWCMRQESRGECSNSSWTDI